MTEHLSAEQIIEFVSIDELTEETMAKMNAVNAHIYQCEECAKRVKAFFDISDEFARIGKLIAEGYDLNELYTQHVEQQTHKQQIGF